MRRPSSKAVDAAKHVASFFTTPVMTKTVFALRVSRNDFAARSSIFGHLLYTTSILLCGYIV